MEPSTISLPESRTDENPHSVPGFPELPSRFAITRRLGGGGFADVYEAMDYTNDHYCAVKVPKADEDMVARFRRECRLLYESAPSRHPNVVQYIDSDATAEPPWLAMELVRGTTLHDLRYARKTRFGDHTIVRYLTMIARALVHFHGHPINDQPGDRFVIHRDISLKNLMLTEDGVIKLIDLGCAVERGGPPDDAQTRIGQTLGTSIYLAPELRGNAIAADQRSDLFSVGVVGFALISLIDDDKSLRDLGRVGSDVVRTRVIDRDPKLVDLIAGLVEFDPAERRPRTAAELVRQLQSLAAALPD